MSKKKELATVNFSPIATIPDDAPPIPFDVTNPALSLDDVLPSNFISMEGLQRWLDDRNAESRILTVTAVTIELLYDPERAKPENGEWKPCLSFVETPSMLVINKTRAEQLSRLVKSPLLANWADAGQIAIKPGIGNGKAQIIIQRPQNGVVYLNTADKS
ncbi:MAG: hypothetical protein GY943_37390 [Chloroflexi bacterium]|nr:hypothetical protein [Chloroflexota bacterium]